MSSTPRVLTWLAVLPLSLGVAAWLSWRYAGSQESAGARLAAKDENLSSLRCSARNATGVGLQGEYFAAAQQRGERLLMRVDPTVEFDELLDWPVDQASKRPLSARWRGWVKAPLSGTYRFHGGPGATINISNQPMAGDQVTEDASIELQAGRFYPVTMEVELSAAGPVFLSWTVPHGVQYVIPRALLFLPTAN